MKQIHTWKEPWKQKENKTQRKQTIQGIDDAHFSKMANQNVKVIFPKLLYRQNFFYSFKIQLDSPLLMEDIMDRVQKAFPELSSKREDL